MKNSMEILILVGVLCLLALTGCAEVTGQAQDNIIMKADEALVTNNAATLGSTKPTPLEVYCSAPLATGSGTSDDPYSYWQGLYMYVDTGSVTPTGLRLSIINDSGQLTFGYGMPFRIEQYYNGRWQQAPFVNEVGWFLPLYQINPSIINDENIEWEYRHGQLHPGQYRITRSFFEYDPFDPTPMWEQDIPEAYLYALFTVEEDFESIHNIWLAEQEALAVRAYSRFDGLDLEILAHSPRALSFTLTNNNPDYSYIINSIFIGWEDKFSDGGHSGAIEYSIFNKYSGWPSPSWPFEEDTRMQSGESLSLEVDWYYEIGNLIPRVANHPDYASPYPNVFDLVVDIALDVDEEYIQKYFNHVIPNIPGAEHRIKAQFELP